MKVVLQRASDPYHPLFDEHVKPNFVEIERFEDLAPYIREGSHGGVIINFISDSVRAMYDEVPKDVRLVMTIYDDWIE